MIYCDVTEKPRYIQTGNEIKVRPRFAFSFAFTIITQLHIPAAVVLCNSQRHNVKPFQVKLALYFAFHFTFGFGLICILQSEVYIACVIIVKSLNLMAFEKSSIKHHQI